MEVLELCFSKQHSMNAWRSALIAPPLTAGLEGATARDKAAGAIRVLPMEVVEPAETIKSDETIHLGVKSVLTGMCYE